MPLKKPFNLRSLSYLKFRNNLIYVIVACKSFVDNIDRCYNIIKCLFEDGFKIVKIIRFWQNIITVIIQHLKVLRK